MRLIGTLEHENDARRFSDHLQRLGIESSVDPSFDPETNQFQYGLWIHNEDQIDEAVREFAAFQQNPTNRNFTQEKEVIPEVMPEVKQERTRKHFPGTYFFLGLCALVYLLNLTQMKQEETAPSITTTQLALLYDVPTGDAPFWSGAYTWFLLKIKGADTTLAEGPLFVKIRQGEIWRLFTPAILHSDFLHILFNMLWLWMLGRQIEKRIGTFRYVLLTLILGISTNTAQYLMSGPFFLGYSGIVLGLAGFIWCREKIAPWEGYPLQRSVFLFLVLFVVALFALQFGALLLMLFTNSTLTPNIANTAHIAGAIFGALLARLSYFSARRTS